MNKIKIYHNPRCSKSRGCLLEINNAYNNVEIIDYTKNRISKDELENVLLLLEMKPLELIRKNEDEYKNLIKNKNLKDDEIIELMLKYPNLIERPIVVNGNKAVIARPLSKLNEIL